MQKLTQARVPYTRDQYYYVETGKLVSETEENEPITLEEELKKAVMGYFHRYKELKYPQQTNDFLRKTASDEATQHVQDLIRNLTGETFLRKVPESKWPEIISEFQILKSNLC